jgi:hypothetical protein
MSRARTHRRISSQALPRVEGGWRKGGGGWRRESGDEREEEEEEEAGVARSIETKR